MSSFHDLTNAVTYKYSDRINKYCTCLFDYFNLFQFYHYEVKIDGRFTSMHSSVAWSEFYNANQFYLLDPYFRHPKFFQEGVVLLKDAKDNSTKQIMRSGKDNFELGFILKLITKTHDGIEVFGFCSRFADETQVSFLLSELPLLRLFIKKFREDNQILFSRLKDNQINFANLIGPSFYENILEPAPNLMAKNAFLRKLGISMERPLTPIENRMLKLAVRGYSAGKIAPQVYLSRRTIEHHMERIKEKLNCASKAELIQKGIELETFGCL